MATYYIDFASGVDTNDGLTRNSAWKSLPGMCTVNNSAWLSTTWGGGVVTSSMKVPAGTTFFIKSGTSSLSAGGQIIIDSTYYANGTSSAYLTFLRDPTWGSGSVTFDATGVTVPSSQAMLDIWMKYVRMDGITPSGFIIKNSTNLGLRCIDQSTGGGAAGANGFRLSNVEVSGSGSTGVRVIGTDTTTPTWLSNVVLDNVIAHDTLVGASNPGDSPIYLAMVDTFTIKNCVVYNSAASAYLASGASADGMHIESCTNGWVTNCLAYQNSNQGFDVSRIGGFKSNDWTSNITFKDCVGYNNYNNNFDFNSGAHHIVYLNCLSYKTASGVLGDSGFNVHQGTQGPNWWINCASVISSDRGINFDWGSNPWSIPAATYNQYVINFLSTEDSTINSTSRGGSIWVGPDDATGTLSAFTILNSNLGTDSVNYGAVNYKGTIYTSANVTASSGGWFGTACFVSLPSWVKPKTPWPLINTTAMIPVSSGGASLFTASATVKSSVTLTVTPAVTGLDVRRVFQAGERIRVGTLDAVIASLPSAAVITLSAVQGWTSGTLVAPYSTLFPDGIAVKYP